MIASQFASPSACVGLHNGSRTRSFSRVRFCSIACGSSCWFQSGRCSPILGCLRTSVALRKATSSPEDDLLIDVLMKLCACPAPGAAWKQPMPDELAWVHEVPAVAPGSGDVCDPRSRFNIRAVHAGQDLTPGRPVPLISLGPSVSMPISIVASCGRFDAHRQTATSIAATAAVNGTPECLRRNRVRSRIPPVRWRNRWSCLNSIIRQTAGAILLGEADA